MSTANEIIIINCDRDAALSISSEIAKWAGNKSQKSERKNLDGSVAGWVVLGTVALKTLPAILEVIRKWVNDKRVQEIKLGDINIKNPTPAQVDELMRDFHGKARQDYPED